MSKTVIITGSFRGIGAEIAKKFATQGYALALVDIQDGGAADEIKTSCIGAGAPEVATIVADVSDYEQCAKLVDAVAEKFGGIYALVNNAGITRDGLLMRMTEEQFDSVINVNLKTVYNMSKLVLPYMVKAREGRILSMASVAGVYGNASQTNYAASKAGIIGFTKSLAKEIGRRNITVNALAPGFIETAMTAKLPEEVREKSLECIALRRMGQASDVAEAAAFLCSEGAAYITGVVLQVDGGISL